ncbi:ABC transporter permease [Streptomyces sp. NBC_00841]|uniref:ABC transporter permease n=1 Tax=unclassified Streptomyces TaxID=2593676 RepID=UPI0022503B70|nr:MULTISPECIES: ABC transporter permease [unclassified Streptomyces]MCX4537540.1 ABC transporter permease [Streptomyces sp. NBC_01669]WRZ97247.1 ABC transporter permease [Streptomyces sp. NBC_00841]
MSDATMSAPVPSGQVKAKQRPAGAMLRFIATRIVGLVVTLFIASLVVFGALYAAPGSPLTYLTHGRTMSPDAIAAIKAEYHLDDSIWQQYLRWLGGVVHGDFGTSIIYNQPVSSLVGSRASATTLLVFMAAAIVLVLGLAIGTLAGLKPGWLSRSAMAGATGVMAVPTFVGAVVLIIVFAVDLEWFPVFGAGRAGLDEVYHLVLPSIALALASVAFVARLAQTAIRQELSADHVQTAISRGLPRAVVVRRHVMRNAAMPVLTVAGLTIAGLIAGSVVVEQVFQLGGLGQFLVNSVQQKDFPVVQAICLMYVAAFIVLNTLIDIAYTLLDPRVSIGKKDS